MDLISLPKSNDMIMSECEHSPKAKTSIKQLRFMHQKSKSYSKLQSLSKLKDLPIPTNITPRLQLP